MPLPGLSLSSRSILWLPACVSPAQKEILAEQESNGRPQPSLSSLLIGGCSSCTLSSLLIGGYSSCTLIQFFPLGLFPILGLRVLLKLLHVTGLDASACIWRHFHSYPHKGFSWPQL